MEASIIDGIRTPVGSYKETLANVRTDDFGAVVIKEIVKRNPSIPIEAYDDVIIGCTNQVGEDNRNVARMSLLLAGLSFTVPGKTINRLYSSGLSAIIHASHAIKVGDGGVFISGGGITRGPYTITKPSSAYEVILKFIIQVLDGVLITLRFILGNMYLSKSIINLYKNGKIKNWGFYSNIL